MAKILRERERERESKQNYHEKVCKQSVVLNRI